MHMQQNVKEEDLSPWSSGCVSWGITLSHTSSKVHTADAK